MAKKDKIYVCSSCGFESSKWQGQCPSCASWNTFEEQSISDSVNSTLVQSSLLQDIDTSAKSLHQISSTKKEIKRLQTGFAEVDRVIGGGLIGEQVLLISGDPGVGKSSLLIQVAAKLSSSKKVLYISGEESVNQVAGRANRLIKSKKKQEELFIANNSNLDSIVQSIEENKPEVVVIDSIQTVFDPEGSGLPGSVAQVRRCAAKLIGLAKLSGFILILVGHINKDGQVAGPKVLEHLVDTVVTLEGDKDSYFRVLRSIKNRFGSTLEVGLLKMTGQGLEDVKEDDELFSSGSQDAEVGVAKALVLEGTRPVVVDIQSLAADTPFQFPKRVADGISSSRMQLILALIQNFNLADVSGKDVYIKTSGGFKIKDYSFADLSVFMSIVSSITGKKIPGNLLFFGEISLNGKINISTYHEDVLSKWLKGIGKRYKVVTAKQVKIKNTNVKKIESISELQKLFASSR